MLGNRIAAPFLAACLLLPALASAGDWSTLMGSASRDGRVGAAGMDGITNFTPAGRFDAYAEIRSSPVVAGETLFFGAENGNLYAVDLDSKKLQWLFHARGGISSTPTVVDGVVYFLSRDGLFHALNAATGKTLWNFRTQGESVFAAHGMYGAPLTGDLAPDAWDLYLSSPLVHDGKVYFGSSDEHVYTLDAKSGKLIWAYKTGGMVHSSPALSGANIVVGSWDGAVYALDASSGEQRWRFQTKTEQKTSTFIGIQASPSVEGDSVYIGSRDGFFYALDGASGALKWSYRAQGSWVVSAAAIDDDHVFFGTSDTGLLLALDKRNGKEVHRFNTGVWTFASPLRVGGLLIGASMKGMVHALDAASGKELWSYRTGAAELDEYQLIDQKTGRFDNKRLFAGGGQAGVEHVKRLGAFIASPLWHNGQLIVANANGEVLFFDAVK